MPSLLQKGRSRRVAWKPGQSGNPSGENTPKVQVFRKGVLVDKADYYIRFTDEHRKKMCELAMESIPRLRQLAIENENTHSAIMAIKEIHNRSLGQAPIEVNASVSHEHKHTFVGLLREVADELKLVEDARIIEQKPVDDA
jgi:hypothetical protein